MKIKASALTAFVAASQLNHGLSFGIVGQKSAFLSSPLQMQTLKSSLSKSTMTMFGGAGGGVEELKNMTKEGDKLTKTAFKSPGLFKTGGIAAIPAAALLGAALVSPAGQVAAVAGSAITGVAGYIGKSRLDAATHLAAKPAIAQAIIDHGVDSSEIIGVIEGIQKKYGVDDEDFASMKSDVYKRYIIGMVKTPITKTAEMKELTNLRNALGMDNLTVGESHGAAAKEFYRQTCIFTPKEDLEDPEHPDRMSIDKFLFLSERVFRQSGETDEAFKYEMSRVAKAFDLKLDEALERVAEVAEPFYQKALDSTRSKLDSDAVSPDMLTRARNSLGINEQTATDMNLATFNDEVKVLLGKSDGIDGDDDLSVYGFAAGSAERLAKLQSILGIDDVSAEYEISVEATPLFQAKASQIMDAAIAHDISGADAWNQLKARQSELLLKDNAMKDLLASMVMQAMGKPFEDTMTFAKVNNEGATYEKLLLALEAKEACRDVLQQSGWEEFSDFDKAFFDPTSKSSACGMLSRQDRLRLFRIFLTRAVRKSETGKELTDENYAKVQEVKKMIGVTDDDEAVEFRMNFGPELQKTLNMAMFEIMSDDYTPTLVKNLKESIDTVVKNYKLNKSLVAEFAAPIYSKAVSIVNDKSLAGIPSKEQMDQLNALRDLLGMSEEDTFASHYEVFGGAYKKSIQESMGSTGVIPKEYREPIEKLRERLGVSMEASRKLYLDAMAERMAPIIEFIVLELERTMLTAEQLSRKRNVDYGEDFSKSGKKANGQLGLGSEANIMTDCMNLIDFYTENDIAEKREIGTKKVSKKIMKEGKEQIISEEVPEYEVTYPITGLGCGAIQQDLAELLFRQFVVGGFTNQGSQGQRYEAARETFGGILGLDKAKQEEVTSSIGSTVYENYISNSMRTKGVLDQQDMMFLANIQSKLGISEERSEEMLLKTQKKLLSEECNALIQSEPTPVQVKTFREKCNSMGLDLEKEIGISKSTIEQLFEAEVSPGLVNGEITIESGEILSEIQESLGLTPEEAEKLFFNIIADRSKASMSRLKAEILRGREENCSDIILRLVRYAQFVNGEDLNLSVDEATAWKIYNLYDAMDFSGQDAEKVESNKEILKTALNLS